MTPRRDPRSVLLLLVGLLSLRATPAEAPAPSEASFYVDYWDRVVRREQGIWPYLGGHGDAVADLATWKFPSGTAPSTWTPTEQARALRTLGSQALDWDRDGLDVLYLQRLFFEVLGVLDAFGASPTWIDPRTCTPETLSDDDAFPRPPWRPTGGIGAALTSEETEEMAVLAGMICREVERRAAAEFLRSTEELAGRLAQMEAATADLAGAGALLRGDPGASGDDLVREVDEAPPAATVLEWVDEVDRILGAFDLRRRLRPDLDTLAAAYVREALAPAARFGALIDCGAWVGTTATFLDEGMFLDAWVDVRDGRFQTTPPPLWGLDPGLGEMAEAVIARVAAALYVLARESADAAGVELLRQEPLEHRIPIQRTPEDRRRMEAEFRRTGGTPDPGGLFYRTWWVGNPLDLRVLWKRSVEPEVLAREFGAPFGEALAAHRDEMRQRVLRFDAEDADPEALLHAVTRLGIDRVLSQPLDAPTGSRLFPWLPASRLEELRAAWPRLSGPARVEGAVALVAQGVAAFGVVRDLPPEPMALFKARAAWELHRCAEPLMSAEEIRRIEPELRHARQNLLDRRHDALAGELRRRCDSGGRVDVLEEAVRALLERALPPLPAETIDDLVAALSLARPCGEDAEAALLRFGAVHEVLSAVFALESHASGGSFDAPFDRSVARQVGTEPLQAMDAWMIQFREQQAAARIWLRRGPSEEPDDRVPLLLHALPHLLPEPGEPILREGKAPLSDWADAYRKAAGGRGYPDDLAATGWRSLDDYIEEEERHRRIQATRIDVGEGFLVRAVFGVDLPVSKLLDGDGKPAAGTEAITWGRPAGGDSRYEVEILRPGSGPVRVVLSVPGNPGTPGPRSVSEAQRFVELYWGWGG